MNCLVTGAAGFIGSHLCRRLLKEEFKVVGIDSFTDFYPKHIKEKNIKPLRKDENFEFITGDLNDLDLKKKLNDILPLLENICQKKVRMVRKVRQKGDMPHTFANIEKARKDLDYSPQIKLRDGLKEEWLWTKKLYSS